MSGLHRPDAKNEVGRLGWLELTARATVSGRPRKSEDERWRRKKDRGKWKPSKPHAPHVTISGG